MKIFAIALTISNFLSYIWSAISVFKRVDKGTGFDAKLLIFLSGLFWVTSSYFLVARNLVAETYIGLSITQAICFFTFWYHAQIVRRNSFSFVFSSDTPRVFVQEGLYRYIRHPFYSTYLICYFSVAIFAGQPILYIISFAMLLIYLKAAKIEENKFLNSPYRSEYLAYCARAGRFLPHLRLTQGQYR